jgi:hypothetical protein
LKSEVETLRENGELAEGNDLLIAVVERKDGWIGDAPRNVLQSQYKAARKLRTFRVL